MGTREATTKYLDSRRWAETTRRTVSGNLLRFAEAVGPEVPVKDIDHDAVGRWWATQAHVCAGTARTRRSNVANFLSWCRHVGLLDGDPMAAIPVPREPRRMPVTLSDDDVAALLGVVNADARARAVVTLMLMLGLRCVDVANLEVHDVDFTRRMLHVTGKGGHVDPLPLPDECAAAIDAYLSEHPAPAGPLFRDARWHTAPITAQRVSDLLREWTTAAGIRRAKWDGRGAHSLRRTCATELLASGATIRQVQAVLRHQSMATTSRYLRASDAEELRAVVERSICA